MLPALFPLLAALALPPIQAAVLNNDNPTIWQQNTIPTMQKHIDILYAKNSGLYSSRNIDCVRHKPEIEYYQNTTCPNANKLAAQALLAVADAWRGLAGHMFPVYYNLTDEDYGPRAGFSGFSHFYNHLLLEIQSLQNTTQYYICRGAMGPTSALWNATGVAHQNNQDYVISRFGPVVSHVVGAPVFANNGTDFAYPYDGHFEKSIRKNSVLEQDGWSDLRILMGQPDAEYSQTVCQRFARNGLLPPKSPGSFP